MLYGITTSVKWFNFNYNTCFQISLFGNFCFLMFPLCFAYYSILAFLLELQSEGKGREFNIKVTFASFYLLTLNRLYHANFLSHLKEDLSKMASDPISPRPLGSYHFLFFQPALVFFMDEFWHCDFFPWYLFSVTSSRMLDTLNKDFCFFCF